MRPFFIPTPPESTAYEAWIENKFRSMAEKNLGAERVGTLLPMPWTLEDCGDMSSLVEAPILE